MNNVIECDDPQSVQLVDPDYKSLWIMAVSWLKGRHPEIHAQMLECFETNGVNHVPMWFIKKSSKEAPHE